MTPADPTATRPSLPPPDRRLALHRSLDAFNRTRLVASLGDDDDAAEMTQRRLERAFVEDERRAISVIAANAPTEADAFVRWFEDLRDVGPGQGDPLFPWLAAQAPIEAMRWFVHQESAGEAGFEDLVALAQLKMPARAKLEMARNYWDEMGQGHAGGMHGPMLERLGRELLSPLDRAKPVAWESLALANLMTALAVHRGYGFEAVGALGAIELTAPGRAAHVNAGLKRLGVGGEARRYFALHATLDVKHARAWNDEVLGPLVAEDPMRATRIAEGALMRLRAGARCYARYRSILWR